MKRFLVTLSLVVVAISEPAFALVETFDFSYVTTSNVTVSGTLMGVENSGIVSGISVSSLTIAGTSLSSPFTIYDFGSTLDGALVSQTLSLNSFLFLSGSSYFEIGTNTKTNAYAYLGAATIFEESPATGNWTLTKRAGNGVPDSGNTALLLSAGLMGLIAFRRARIVV